jgi:3',5'-nucleoside bisphosphate phosphatase
MAGYETVLPLALQHPDITLIPGIEMSAEGEHACHLLGYFVRAEDPQFQEHLVLYRQRRVERVRAMVARLVEMGIAISYDQVLRIAGGGSVGRPHIADALIENRVVRQRQDAFNRFLKRGGPAYVPSESPTAEEILQVIRRAGGIPVLAHPVYDVSDALIEKLAGWGLLGIEAYYPEHSRALTQHWLDLASRHGLISTGGSDYHGPRTGRRELACVDVPESVLPALESARTRAAREA